MRVEEIEIHTGTPAQTFKRLGELKAKVGAATLFSKTPTIEDVNFKLREQAARLGANAVVNVAYDRGVTMTSWKGLTATGTAVLLESDTRPCPLCAEPIKREAVRCKHCGGDVAKG